MNIQRLTLENFGPYNGVHKIDFSTTPERPVVLVGALNGGGKTSMLEAIKLVLFGRSASIARVGPAGYKAYLRSAINSNADPSDGARIALEFTRAVDGKLEAMRVVRSWSVDGQSLDERITVERAGVKDPALSSERDWDLYVHGCLPQSLADLFFFDGDNIKKFADEQSAHGAKKLLKDGVGFLFGTDSVDRMIGDLDTFIQKCLATEESAEDVSARAALEVKHADAEKILAEKTAVLEIKKDTFDARCKDYDAIFKEFKLRGGEVFDNFSTYQKEFEEAQRSLEAATEGLVRLAAGASNLLPLANQLKELRSAVEVDNQAYHESVALAVIRARDTKLIEFMDEVGYGACVAKVSGWLSDDIRARESAGSKAIGLGCPVSLPAEITSLLGPVFDSVRSELMSGLELYKSSLERQEGAERSIAQVPSQEYIREVKADLESAMKSKASAEAAMLAAEAEFLSAKGACVDLAGELTSHKNKLFDRNQFATEERLMADKALHAKGLLVEYKTKLLTSRIVHIEQLIVECLQRLMRKKDQIVRVKISVPDFDIKLFTASGNEVAYGRLSEGERQMLITSIVWGLARASGKVFPLVVDTPLARLDSKHRGNLTTEFYPNASHQSIIFSTDEEYVGPRLKEIEPYVCRFYTLVNDGVSSSVINPTYFS
jgi:DNA sulfur modification protein DndD